MAIRIALDYICFCPFVRSNMEGVIQNKIAKISKNTFVRKKSRSSTIALPEMLTMIRQPNSVTNAKYNYTLIQQRVFISLIKELQTAITQHNNNGVPLASLLCLKNIRIWLSSIYPCRKYARTKDIILKR